MQESLNIDAVVKLIKNLVDSNCCAVCDKTDGTRMRYACGHTSCEDCVAVAPACSVCFTPPANLVAAPVVDKPYNQRAKNAVNLLNVFQNAFHIDVYKRQRLSEQLKIEKEIFPECIQAPAKYTNKRKSIKNIKGDKNKENKLSQLPGENIPSGWDHKMENSHGNVEQWLNKYVRKPFADLNSNDERLISNTRTINKLTKDVANENISISRKRSYFKTAQSVVQNQSHIDKHITPVKKKVYTNKKTKITADQSLKCEPSKYFKRVNNTKVTDEGGIGIYDQTIISLDDSENIRVDKDLDALLAVQEADKNRQYKDTSMISVQPVGLSSSSQSETPLEAYTKLTKVPFILKGKLAEKCIECNTHDIYETVLDTEQSNKDVSITVDSKHFAAIISIKQVGNTKIDYSMHSVEVQTDMMEPIPSNVKKYDQVSNVNIDEESVKKMSTIKAHDPQIQSNKRLPKNNVNAEIKYEPQSKTQNVIIEESDSDEELEASLSLEVTAEVHHSCKEMDYRILGDVENLIAHCKRPRRSARGYTPTSTDSSEKENYNPNRQKKAPSSKKKPMKK